MFIVFMVIQRTIHQMYHGTTRGRNLGGTGHIVPIHDKITCQEVITRGIVRYDMSRLIITVQENASSPFPPWAWIGVKPIPSVLRAAVSYSPSTFTLPETGIMPSMKW